MATYDVIRQTRKTHVTAAREAALVTRTARLLEHEAGRARLQARGDGGDGGVGHVRRGGRDVQQRTHATEGADQRQAHGAVGRLSHLRAQEAIAREVGLAEVELHLRPSPVRVRRRVRQPAAEPR